jgi:hypothetical protein
MRNPPLALTRREADIFGGKCLELGSFPIKLRLTGSFVRLTTATYEPWKNILKDAVLDSSRIDRQKTSSAIE